MTWTTVCIYLLCRRHIISPQAPQPANVDICMLTCALDSSVHANFCECFCGAITLPSSLFLSLSMFPLDTFIGHFFFSFANPFEIANRKKKNSVVSRFHITKNNNTLNQNETGFLACFLYCRLFEMRRCFIYIDLLYLFP